MASVVETLQKNINDYKDHISQIERLHQETKECFKEIQDLINIEQQQNPHLVSALELPKFDFKDRLPCVLFIGRQNCGKSTLLNAFLREPKLLPVHENPCTSRIVRVVYSETNYVKLFDTDMQELDSKGFTKRVPRTFIVLNNNDREDETQLNKIVEVGIQHELLECGIELLDSPGRNENPALDRVVDEFVRKGIVPLIVYIVDGKQQVQNKDRTTIRELQDKFPNVSLMFVCSKVDIEIKALQFDYEHDTDDEEDSKDYSNPSEELFQRASEKKEKVFRQLKAEYFLSVDESIESSSNFHGVSAKNVYRARKHKTQNDDTRNFDRFQCCVLEILKLSLKRDCAKTLENLISAQEMILCITTKARKSLSSTINLMPSVCDTVLNTELQIFQTTFKLDLKSNIIKETICFEFNRLSSELFDEVENSISLDRESMDQSLESIQSTASVESECLRRVLNDDWLAIEFTRAMKETIANRTFNLLRHSIRKELRELSNDVRKMIKSIDELRNPLVSRLMKRSFEFSTEPEDVDNLERHMILDGLLESVDSAVSSTIGREISDPLNEFNVNEIGRNPKPRNAQWRCKVVKTLFSKLDYEQIASSVIEACEASLLSLHQRFRDAIGNYRAINTILEGQHLTSTLEHLRSDYVPHIAELAVRGHSLRYVIERGPPILGQKFKDTEHSQIYSCSSSKWRGNEEECMVKVVKKSEVDLQVWKQTMMDCILTLNIKEKLDETCRYHLQLYGWYFIPEPEQLYLVMEKTEGDLLRALKHGLSWKRRKEVAMDVAKGLEAIHRVDYVYQDLKAQNIMLAEDGTAKINLAKPEKPFENTKLGIPFHISPEMFKNYYTDSASAEFDIYAFGSLLWVLCEGSGDARPKAYSHCPDIEAMKYAVCYQRIKPERPQGTPDAWWNLMTKCWSGDVSLKINGVMKKLYKIVTTE